MATAALAGGAHPAPAQCVATETAKLLPDDGDWGDEFGLAVSVSGGVAVIGAPQDGDNGDESGSAYVFRNTGAAWVQEAKLSPDDGAPYARFGWSVSVSGDVAVIGADRDTVGAAWSGSAYVFRYNGTAWVQEAKLVADDGASDDAFGQSVSVSGDVAVIGAWGDDDNDSLSGSAYVFRRTGTAWVQDAKLLPDDGAFLARFGSSVSVEGDIAVIGAQWDDDNGFFSGSAYVFRHKGTAWVQDAKLLPDDGAAQDRFGIAVSVSGNVAVIGAHWADGNGDSSGSAYVFRRNGTAWVQEAELLPGDAAPSDQFGVSVSVSGHVAVIGANLDDDNGVNSGSAYVFRDTGTAWVQEAKLLPHDGATQARFGVSVAVAGDVAVVGAIWDEDNATASGSAYVFGGLGDCNVNDTLDLCDIADGTSDDADGDGVPDECTTISIIASDPPDGAIDARQPSAPDGSKPAGWSAVTLTFDGDAGGVMPGDFAITVNPDDTTPPQLVSVKTDGATATLEFDMIIPLLHWTTITHVPSDTSTRIGYLPADVDNDRTSDANDVLALIDHLNGAIDPLADYQTDIDRSGIVNANDILRTIDLFWACEFGGCGYGITLPD
ncbi:MAG: hypothetical protein ACE5E6_09940 [Phycisphaerae bacterium]